MYNSRTIQILKSFSKDEISGLDIFINSKITKISSLDFQKHYGYEKIIELFKIFKKSYPVFTSKILMKENVYKKLFPGEIFDDKKLRIIRYDFLKILELYLSFIDIFENPLHSKLHLINQIEKRSIDNLLNINLKEAEDIIKCEKIENEDYFMLKYQLSQKKRNLLMKDKYLGKTKRYFEIFDEEKYNTLNSFAITILKQLSYFHHFKNHLNITNDFSYHEEIYNSLLSKYIDKNPQKNLVLNIWLKIVSLHYIHYLANDVTDLEKLILDNKKKFNKDDFIHLNSELYNYCVRRYELRDTSFKPILISLVKGEINKVVHNDRGKISERYYSSTISLALRLEEFELAEKFINTFKDQVSRTYGESLYNYNYGSLFYRTKKFDEALEYLSKVKTNDYFYTIESNNMRLKIFFEKHELELAFTLIDTYEHYLSYNETIPEDFKLMNLNFLKFYEDILRMKNGSTRITKGELIDKINSTKSLSYRGWLLNSLNNLKNSKYL